MDDKKIARINELYRKSKTAAGLTEEEKAEQTALRNEYRRAVTASLSSQLDNTVIVSPDGTRQKVSERKKG